MPPNPWARAFRAREYEIAGLAVRDPGRPTECLENLRYWVSTSTGELSTDAHFAQLLCALFWAAREHYAENGRKEFWPGLEEALGRPLSAAQRHRVGEWYLDALRHFDYQEPPSDGTQDYVNRIVFHAGLPDASVPGLLRLIAEAADQLGDDAAELTAGDVADLAADKPAYLHANLHRLLTSRWHGVTELWVPLARIVLTWLAGQPEAEVEELRGDLPPALDWRPVAEALQGLARPRSAGGPRAGAAPPPQLRFDEDLGAVRLWVPTGGPADWTVAGADGVLWDRTDRGWVAHLTMPPADRLVATSTFGSRRTFRPHPAGFPGLWFNARSGVLVDGGDVDWNGLAPGEYFLLLQGTPAAPPGDAQVIDWAAFGGGDWTCWRVEVPERSATRTRWEGQAGGRGVGVDLARRPAPRIELPEPVAYALVETGRDAGETIPVYDRVPEVRAGKDVSARVFLRARPRMSNWPLDLRAGEPVRPPAGGAGVYFLKCRTGVTSTLARFAVLPGLELHGPAYDVDDSRAAVTVRTQAPGTVSSTGAVDRPAAGTWVVSGGTVNPSLTMRWDWPEGLRGDLTFRFPVRGLRWRLHPRTGESGPWARSTLVLRKDQVTTLDQRLEIQTPGRGEVTLNGRPITRTRQAEVGGQFVEELTPHVPSGRLAVGWAGAEHLAVLIADRPHIDRLTADGRSVEWRVAGEWPGLVLAVWDPTDPATPPRELPLTKPDRWVVDWDQLPKSANEVAVCPAARVVRGFGKATLQPAAHLDVSGPAVLRMARSGSPADGWPALAHELTVRFQFGPAPDEADVLARLRELRRDGRLPRGEVSRYADRLTGSRQVFGDRLRRFLTEECGVRPRAESAGFGPGEGPVPYPPDLVQYVDDLARLGVTWAEATGGRPTPALWDDLARRADRVMAFHQDHNLPYAGLGTAWACRCGYLTHPRSGRRIDVEWEGYPCQAGASAVRFRAALGLTDCELDVQSDYLVQPGRPPVHRPLTLAWDPIQGSWLVRCRVDQDFAVPAAAFVTPGWSAEALIVPLGVEKRLRQWSDGLAAGAPADDLDPTADTALRSCPHTWPLHARVLEATARKNVELWGTTSTGHQAWPVTEPVVRAWRLAWLDRLACWRGSAKVFHGAGPLAGLEDAAARATVAAHRAWPALMARMTALAEFCCWMLLGGGLGLAARSARPARSGKGTR
jgi:hypothetical protein